MPPDLSLDEVYALRWLRHVAVPQPVEFPDLDARPATRLPDWLPWPPEPVASEPTIAGEPNTVACPPQSSTQADYVAPKAAPELATLRDKGLVEILVEERGRGGGTFSVHLTTAGGERAAQEEQRAANGLQGVAAIQEFGRCLGRLVVAVTATKLLRDRGHADATMGDLTGLPIDFAKWKLDQTVESAARAATSIDDQLSLDILKAREALCLPLCGYPFKASNWLRKLRPRMRRAAMLTTVPEAPEHVVKAQSLALHQRHSDEPDEHGYVESPADPSAYVAASKIIAEYTPAKWCLTMMKLKRLLDSADYAVIRVRWTRPGRQRRNVHLADWLNYVERRKAGGENDWPTLAAGELEARTAAVRHSRA